ncbi:MAG: hypothetical protein ACE5GX_03540 [Thermoanaerobaculia bacterium]
MRGISDALPGWIALVLALAGVAYSALVVPATPGGPTEATYRLQAESLGRDGDRVYSESDRDRFASREWTTRGTRIEVSLERETLRFHRPLPYSAALAPFVRIAPERGPYLLNLLLLGGLALALGVRLHRDSPRGAPYWSLALVAGTVSFAYVRAVWSELFVGALLVGAYLLTRDEAPRRELPEMAPESPARGLFVLRWFGVGALLALATLQEPLYAVFLPAVLVPAFRSRDEVAWASAIGSFSLILAAAWLAGGVLFPGVAPWWPDAGVPVRAGDSLADVGEWAARLQAVEAPGLVWDPLLSLWNVVYALVGRHAGWVPCFLPLVVLAATGRRHRWPIWGAMTLVLVATITLDPFNIAGGPEAIGYRRLVPPALLAFFAVRPERAAVPAAAAAALGVAVLAPLWIGLADSPGRLRGRSFARPVAAVLPYETSQRSVPASAEVFSRLFLARTANDGLLPGSGGDHFVLRAGARGEIVVASAGRLAHLDFEFGPGAPSELEVDGGEVENLLFRPQGGVTFRVVPATPRIRHRIWGRDDIHFLHMLTISMPSSEGRDQPFSLTGRSAGDGAS